MGNGSLILICLCIYLTLGYCEGIYEPGTQNGVKTGVYTRDPRITSSIQGNYGQHHYNPSDSQHYSRVTTHNEREVPIYNRQQREYHGQQHRYDEQSQFNADETQNFLNQYFTECPPGATGQFAYLLNCRQFLNCWKGRGIVQNCPPATAFNAASLECDWPNKVVCHGLGPTTRQPRKLHFNGARIEEHNPYAPARVPVGGTNRQAEVKCGPHDMGLFPHPYDCRKFLNCAHGRTFIQSCGPGTGFDSQMKVCDHLRKLNCASDSTIELSEEYDKREDYVPHTHPSRIPIGSATHTSPDQTTSQTQYHEVHTHHRYPDSDHQATGTQHQHREYRPVPTYGVQQQQFEPVYPTRQIQAGQHPQTGPHYEGGQRRERLYPDYRRGGVETFDDQQTNISGYGNVCEFNCGNGKCVKTTEICDGVNDCGNRLDEKSCDHIGFQIRLSGEEGHSHMGRIEVKAYGKWGYVCDDKFGMRDANVACKELGFPLGASEVRAKSYYMPHTAMKDERNQVLFMMDEVQCIGNETSLRECDFKGWGVHDCSVNELVGVVCKIPVTKCPHDYWMCASSQICIPPAFVCDNVPDCPDKSDESPAICNASIEYRLAQGGNSLEGRVEVKYRGIWGTVCDDDFGETEAQVVCNSLGYYGKATSMKNAFGPGAGPIWLDQVACDGSESSLDKCSHFSWGEHNCNHTEDVSIRCTIGVPPTTSIQANNQEFQIINETNYWDESDVYLYQVERSSKNLPLPQQLCGQISRNLANESNNNNMYMARIISGKSVKRGHHPWQATIRAKGRAGKSTHWCGAALISRWHLLTAAHCLINFTKGAFLVRLGDHYANIVEPSEIEVFIENWYIHEEFRKGQHMNNDIAVIVLKNPVSFSDYIWPICLPDKTANYDTGRECTISGWGSIQSGVSTPSNDLRAAKIPILSQDICKRPYVYGNSITEGMFCAGSLDEGADACRGDSGGPLSCTDGEQETLYGVISWGQHCGYVNKPGVYVKVSHYLDWITEQMSKFRKPRTN